MSLREAIEGKNGVFYGRHSTDKQEMVMQRRVATQLVTEFNGMLLPIEYPDENVSATKIPLRKRKNLARMLDDAKEHKFDFIVTYARDRLARDAYEHHVIREEMHELGIPVVLASTRSVYDLGDVVIELMQDGLSQYEVEQTRVRTRDTLVHRVEHGEWVGRKPPYGYIFDEGKIRGVPDEIIIVRDIFDRYLKGEGCYRIAKAIRWGKDKKDKVKAIVTNPFYAGYMTAYKGKRKSHNSISDRSEWVESPGKLAMIPAILTKEDWERCWNLFDQRRKGTVPPKHYNTNFVLKGLVRCKYCGQSFKTVNKTPKKSTTDKSYRYYLCSCRRFRAEEFEQSIVKTTLEEVNRRSLVPGGVAAIMDEVRISLDDDVKTMRADIKGLQKQVAETKAKIEEADNEMHSLYKAAKLGEAHELDEKQKRILEMLQYYRLEKQGDCNRWEEQINKLKTKLEFMEAIEIKHLDWNKLYADVVTGDRQALRRFLLFLITEIWVDADGNVDKFEARVDLN